MTDNTVTDGEFWFLERHTPNIGITLKVKEHLYSHRSSYQLIEVFDTYEYGRVLTLDRLIMVTERDEAAYHEMLTHVPMLIHPNPRRVLVIGGGDGGVLRELVKHPTLEKAIQVEIDVEVVETSCRFLPGIASAFENQKVELVIDDALDYIRKVHELFDLIIIDSTDPIGPAEGLFEPTFYKDVFAALNKDGIMTCQLGAPIYDTKFITRIVKHLENLFDDSGIYLTNVPCYPSGLWCLGIASKSHFISAKPDEVRYRTFKDNLNYYNPIIHHGSFMLPEYLQHAVIGN